MRQTLSFRCCWQFTTLLISIATSWNVSAQTDSPETLQTTVIDFQRDIAPILATRCLECHGPKEAKNDFRVDDREMLLGQIQPGDASASSLWTDFLRSTDPEMLMPPKNHGGPLTSSELALIHVWISEGASWPEGATIISMDSNAPSIPVPSTNSEPASILSRIWAFQGFLHPATVHFPIALLLVGGLFVIIGWKFPALGQNVALACLFLGTVSAVAASTMGWSFAVRQGYGGWDRFDMDSEIFWHRWSALIVTFAAIATSLFALAWLRSGNEQLAKCWKIGLLGTAAMVGAVGHQGGELTYGKTLYHDAFNVLLGNDGKASNANASDTAPVDLKPSEPKTKTQ